MTWEQKPSMGTRGSFKTREIRGFFAVTIHLPFRQREDARIQPTTNFEPVQAKPASNANEGVCGMKSNLAMVLSVTLSVLLSLRAAAGCGGGSPRMLLSETHGDRELAIDSLREDGPIGLTMTLRYRDNLIKNGEDPKSAKIKSLDEAIDQIGGAKYCTTSRLYWFTDLEQAKAAAAEEGKPILSLRMLGKLTDELSCANSRFFRTTLYANEEISKLLREKFVLHWQSVRPVPKITIDFGDGRKLERTITGNSAHYVLLQDGTVVDCLPGLYGPQSFRDKLNGLLKVVEAMPTKPEMRQQYLVAFHQAEETKINQAWQADLEKLGVGPTPNGQVVLRPTVSKVLAADKPGGPPPAEAAAKIARPKAMIEMPAIAAVKGRVASMELATTEQVWEQIAALHAEESRLDQSSRNLIASQNPTAAMAGLLAITKARVESPLVKVFRNLEQSVAVDSVRNEYELHRKLHRWFVEGSAAANVDELNDRVYAELFLTPKTDPWLGLLQGDAYSALPNNGVVKVEQP
jgi:hypothetical protein